MWRMTACGLARWIVCRGKYLLLGWSLISGMAALSPGIADAPPKLAREFRAAWIATAGNIDWPSRQGLTAAEQKAELRVLLDTAVKLRLNAVFFQIRPASDAFYKSSLEPWSEFLTGTMGKAPEPSYDPLQYAVTEAHARGLELHAWFNPYRAGFASTKRFSAQHISRTHPSWIRRYGNLLWLDPAEAGVQDHVTRVVLDVVRRYDIDGVHLDDYFYPYPDAIRPGVFRSFPDDITWKRYTRSGGKLDRNEWRRENVNKLVQRLQREIRQAKPWVMFGISPFGIWRPGNPPQIKGLDAYDWLYADSRQWLTKGWVDYLAPQLYWPISQTEQSYPVLLDWWSRQSGGVPVWPGGDVSKAGKTWSTEETVRQIELTRKTARPGFVHWHLGALAKNPELVKRLSGSLYAEPAVVHSVRNSTVPQPTVSTTRTADGKHVVRWSIPDNQKLKGWILQINRGSGWKAEILTAGTRSWEVPAGVRGTVAITAENRYRALSPVALLRF